MTYTGGEGEVEGDMATKQLSGDAPVGVQPGGHEGLPSPPSSADVVRLSVNLAPDVANALKDTAKRHNITVTEAVRQAISLLKFFDDVLRRRAKVLIEEPDGTQREIIFFR